MALSARAYAPPDVLYFSITILFLRCLGETGAPLLSSFHHVCHKAHVGGLRSAAKPVPFLFQTGSSEVQETELHYIDTWQWIK